MILPVCVLIQIVSVVLGQPVISEDTNVYANSTLETLKVHMFTDGSSAASRSFTSEDSLFKSEFWKRMQKEKDPQTAESTVIYLEDSNTVLYFGESEVNRNEKRNPFRKHGPTRDVDMIEVDFGPKEQKFIYNMPVSMCVSSKLSSSGASYTQSYKWTNAITIGIDVHIGVSVYLAGVSLSAGNDDLSLSYTNTGSITCNAAPGKSVQVFGSFIYAFFPHAKKRNVILAKTRVSSGPWAKIASSKPDFRKYGAVFFDLFGSPNYFCVDKEEKLKCREEDVVDNTEADPLDALNHA
ncbi:uncharacterized protein RJT20DRAFT_148218 [Scheffersomyces xylosifermentans]|uniref:uncharacterized protein n=1 Tax=Scheffersomyces xylosifermentans TaxID=1304137 RepID=UPI00315C7BCF